MGKNKEYEKQDLALISVVFILVLGTLGFLTIKYGPGGIEMVNDVVEAERIRALTGEPAWVLPTQYKTRPILSKTPVPTFDHIQYYARQTQEFVPQATTVFENWQNCPTPDYPNNCYPQLQTIPSPEISGPCVTIDKQSIPNAFRAWKQLNSPDELLFCDLEGPGATGSCEVINSDNLPWWVHKGDQFCKVKDPRGNLLKNGKIFSRQPSPKSKPVAGSFKGF